jgi:hypothetical protein
MAADDSWNASALMVDSIGKGRLELLNTVARKLRCDHADIESRYDIKPVSYTMVLSQLACLSSIQAADARATEVLFQRAFRSK